MLKCIFFYELTCLAGYWFLARLGLDAEIVLIFKSPYLITEVSKWVILYFAFTLIPIVEKLSNICMINWCISFKNFVFDINSLKAVEDQKQPPRGVLRKRCSENIQQIYRRTPMPKCDFNKIALQLYWNHTSAWVFSCKLAGYFQDTIY